MSKKSFGMDEMAALAGGAVEEMAAFRPSGSGGTANGHKKLPNEQPDLSTMSAAETAAMLQRKSSAKAPAQPLGRHRTTRLLAHHALAEEISHEFQVRQERQPFPGGMADEKEDEFITQPSAAARRNKAAPQIVARRSHEAQESQRKRPRPLHDSSSSSSSSSDESKRRRRRRNRRQGSGEQDSSSSDDEADRRRERLRAGRQRQEPRVVTLRPAAKFETIEPLNAPQPSMAEQSITSQANDKDGASQNKPMHTPIPSGLGSDSGSDEDSSSSSDDSSSEESSDEEEDTMAKPLFVPKHKRKLVQDEEKKWEEEERKVEMEKKMASKRKLESRTLVAKTVAAVQEKSLEDDMEDEGAGASNAPPNDDDDLDAEQARDAWEVRELRRLLDVMDEMKRLEREQLERDRRRHMTDEEVLEYDKKVGKYQAPGSSREGPGVASAGMFMQRYYHRGAFYMDKEEFDEEDVRHRAAEYARAATGDDKIDKKALPKVMQVKGFGFARQNAKYKGLAKEDTTDKRQELLPIVFKKK